ncbi:Integrase [Microbulbifer thermotolerans]|nr:Integrase [Microbulbifer thermotolerans]
MAAEMRAQAQRGVDPIEWRKSEREAAARVGETPTFAELAERFISEQEPGWSGPKQAPQWRASLKAYVFPYIGSKTPGQISGDDVLALLRKIWTKRPETASRVRQRIERVLNYAAAQGHRDRSQPNPAAWRGNLDNVLPPHRKIQPVQHFPALPHQQAPDFWAWLKDKHSASAQALKLLILSACRTREVLGARWDEIDIDAAVWTVPRERMKARKPHTVPLSTQALEVLASIPRTKSPFLFPGRGRKVPHMSNMSMLVFLRKNGHGDVTPHGMRSTFRDWASDCTSFDHATCEQSLAHTISNAAEAAYRRGEQLAKRRQLMQAWSDFLEGKPYATAPDLDQAQPDTADLARQLAELDEDQRQRLLEILQTSD